MSKRKLTRRQSWRIEKIQSERRERAQKRALEADQQLASGDLGPEQNGQIITHFGSQVLVEARDGPHAGAQKRCHFRSNLGSLVTGDQVVWRDGEPFGVVVAIQPRNSELCRPDPYGEMKTIAANIDRIAIVIAPYPQSHATLVDRYLVAAELSRIRPMLIINKQDSLDDDSRPHLEALAATYTELGYTVCPVSTKTGRGLDELAEYLADFTSVFVGQSGVGKSSLVNALVPDSELRVGALSESRQGTHTTTNARLLRFPGGGQLIDSPGIREFGLWHMDPEQVLEGFVEFRPFIGHCKFRDCTHRREPGCALLQALADGHISQSRMDSYRRILSSLN